MSTTRTVSVIVAAAAVGAVAIATPTAARSLFDAKNAHKVDGYHAAQLNKISHYESDVINDDFDTCTFTSIFSVKFKAPAKGVVSVDSSVAGAADVDFTGEGELTTRILVDGAVSSLPATVNLENNGSFDGNSNNIGAAKVKKGSRTVSIEARECGTGAAFIVSKAITVNFSTSGTIKLPAAKPVARQNR